MKQQDTKTSPAAPGGLQHTLEERISMYKIALQNSKTAGEASKVRRYERGLKVSRASFVFSLMNPKTLTLSCQQKQECCCLLEESEWFYIGFISYMLMSF